MHPQAMACFWCRGYPGLLGGQPDRDCCNYPSEPPVGGPPPLKGEALVQCHIAGMHAVRRAGSAPHPSALRAATLPKGEGIAPAARNGKSEYCRVHGRADHPRAPDHQRTEDTPLPAGAYPPHCQWLLAARRVCSQFFYGLHIILSEFFQSNSLQW